MNGIYETRGRAREYCELAVNLYRGCGHGCTYCYVPEFTHQDPKEFYEKPLPRMGILDQLKKDCKKLGDDRRPVLLCFACDPYQPIDDQWELTRAAIKVLHEYRFPVVILTKGGKRAMRDFDLLGPGDQFGVTMTCLDDAHSLRLEPGAALPSDRITSLIVAKSKGIKTWVSLEPILNVGVAKQVIEIIFPIVGHFKVGKMNHRELLLDWSNVALELKATLDKVGARYYIKKDLAAHLGQDAGFWGGEMK